MNPIYKRTATFIKEKTGENLDELKPDYKVSTGNAKLRKDGIVSFNLIPVVHCPSADICEAYCYADVGMQAYRGSRLKRARAYLATLEADFVPKMIAELSKLTKFKTVRIHDSGDFYSRKYYQDWQKIMSALPELSFYAYTKQIRFMALPSVSNFNLIQSWGGKCDSSINMAQPHAKIFNTVEELLDAGYVDCSESDLPAAQGAVKVGLVIHGIRKARFKQK